MSDSHRSTGPTPEEWWLEDPEPRAKDNYTPDDGALALEYLADGLFSLNTSVGETDTMLADATRFLAESLNVQALVDTVAIIQDLRRRLGVAEAYVAREVGQLTQMEGQSERVGFTSDGRAYEVMRGANRKAWDHEGWQRDARAAIITKAGVSPNLVDPATGESVSLVGMMTEAEALHGSTAPRVTALKGLGLDVGDYCETTRGYFTVKVSQTTTTPGDATP